MTPDDNSAASPSEDPRSAGDTRVRRRTLLTAGAATLLGSGCIQQSQSLVDRSKPRQPSLTIKTVPADVDARATTIARFLSERLSKVGVHARVALLNREELYRDVLLSQSFDLYVARHPHVEDPDFLRPLLHSRFSSESGWQNPFGYTNLELDDLLERQRHQSGARRVETLRDVQRTVVRDQPFTVVAFPEEIRTARTDRVAVTGRHATHAALRCLTASPTEDWERRTDDGDDSGHADADGETQLRATISDSRATKSLNPLAVEFRNGSSILDLLYDSVGRWLDGRVRPWLASDWEWQETADGTGPQAVVTLRDDLTWHDGTPLTATDVTFTYRFLRDTSLGKSESAVPAPNYRGETSLVESVWSQSDDRVVVQFRPVSRRVAMRAFTVPVLPEHVWAQRSRQATIAGVDTGGSVTQALVWNNLRPVGSGPLRFERAKTKESLVLRRFEDHFLEALPAPDAEEAPGVDSGSTPDSWTDPPPTWLEPYAGGFAFDTLAFVVVPSTQAAVALVREGAADFTGSPLSWHDVPRIGRADDLELRVTRPNAFYHVGFNARTPPTSNTRFRRAVAHLVDKAYVAEEFFGGYAAPATSPLARTDACAPELRWDGADPSTPFPGRQGRLDVERARELFRDAGYRFSKDGELLVR